MAVAHGLVRLETDSCQHAMAVHHREDVLRGGGAHDRGWTEALHITLPLEGFVHQGLVLAVKAPADHRL